MKKKKKKKKRAEWAQLKPKRTVRIRFDICLGPKGGFCAGLGQAVLTASLHLYLIYEYRTLVFGWRW